MITRPKLNIVDNFTILPNAWLRDTRLSRKARGLLAELMSHRPGWEISLASLVDTGPEGIDAIRTAVKELADLGYLKVVRARDDAGKLQGVDYVVQDPAEGGISPISDNPKQGNPKQADPRTKKTISSEDHFSEDDGGLFDAPAPATVKASSKQASTAPDDFNVTAEMDQWAGTNAPLADVHSETLKFLDYHRSKGNRFKDWPAAWRNWMRNANDYAARDRQRQPVPNREPGSSNGKLGLEYGGWDN